MFGGIADAAVEASQQALIAILAFLGEQGADATDGLIEALLDLSTFTPWPGNASGWYTPPSDVLWEDPYDIWQTSGQPLALLIVISTTAIYGGMAATGNRGPTFRQGALYTIFGWFMVIWGWEVVSFSFHLISIIGDIVVIDALEPETMAEMGLNTLILVVGLVLIWLNFWIILVAVLVFGLRVAILLTLAPWIPAIVAARAIPIKGISGACAGISKTVAILVLLPIPVSIVLSIGFSADVTQALDQVGVGSALLAISIRAGSLLGAVFIPWAMLQSSGIGLASVGVAGTTASAGKMKKSYERQKKRAGKVKNTATRFRGGGDSDGSGGSSGSSGPNRSGGGDSSSESPSGSGSDSSSGRGGSSTTSRSGSVNRSR